MFDDVGSKYVPPHVNIFYCFGGLVFTSFIAQVTTGAAMTFYYVPEVSRSDGPRIDSENGFHVEDTASDESVCPDDSYATVRNPAEVRKLDLVKAAGVRVHAGIGAHGAQFGRMADEYSTRT